MASEHQYNAPTHPISKRNDGSSHKPHVHEEEYRKLYAESVEHPAQFWDRVSAPLSCPRTAPRLARRRRGRVPTSHASELARFARVHSLWDGASMHARAETLPLVLVQAADLKKEPPSPSCARSCVELGEARVRALSSRSLQRFRAGVNSDTGVCGSV